VAVVENPAALGRALECSRHDRKSDRWGRRTVVRWATVQWNPSLDAV